MAKPKTKAAVKRKPAKTQARAAAARPAKASKKTVAAKPAKASAAKAAKTSLAKPSPVKPSVAKVAASAAAPIKPVEKPATAVRKTEQLTLPAAKQNSVPAAPAPAPPVVRKIVAPTSPRADLPPVDGFTLLVDGHFKNQFDDLKGAKAAASELKSRFPMLRVEIYDAEKKARLPA